MFHLCYCLSFTVSTIQQKLIDGVLKMFCVDEHIDDPSDLYAAIEEASCTSRTSDKQTQMLLAAADFNKFVKLMKKEKRNIWGPGPSGK